MKSPSIASMLVILVVISFRPCYGFSPPPNVASKSIRTGFLLGDTTKKARTHKELLLFMRKKSEIELGVQTAQLLLDRRRHESLKKKLSSRFPLVPGPALDSAIRLIANGFSTVAPAKLKLALSPGGMGKVQPEIRQAIVETTLQQRAVQNFALLNENEKKQLLTTLVDMSMDMILKDAEWVLSAPEVRLEALEQQMDEIVEEMGTWRLVKYKVRRNLLEYSAIAMVASFWLLSYQQGSAFKAALSVKSTVVAAAIFGKMVALNYLLPFAKSVCHRLVWSFKTVKGMIP